MKTPHFSDFASLLKSRMTARLVAALVLTAAALSVPAVAQAQTKGKGKGARTLTFEDDVIETAYIKPEGGAIDVKQNQRQSLIRIRTNFFAELFRSAEDL